MDKLKVTNDFVFKRIFAKKGNEEILKDLLISILEIPIEEIEVIAEANLERKLEKDKLGMHFIQLPRFIEENKKNNPKVNKKLRQWMHFISNQDKGEVKMAIEENEEIKKASKELEYLSGDEEERRLAYLREKALRDEASNLIGAREEGKKEGIKEEKIEIAQKMLEENIDIELIKKITNLTREEIEKLK